MARKKTLLPPTPDGYEKTLKSVAGYYGVSPSQMASPRRTQDIAWARQVAMYVLRHKCRLPYKVIGMLLGGRDRSTIVHGIKRVSKEMTANGTVRVEINGLLK